METIDKKKGKNFSCNNCKGQRKKSDFYETPYSITEQLLEREHFNNSNSFLEPCCGNGAIVKVLKKHNLHVNYYDIKDGINFLDEKKYYDNIITNPPFSLAKEFILKCKEIVNEKFALLLPLNYLHGEERYKKIYKDTVFPLKCIYIFTRYPLLGEFLREDGKYHTGMIVYTWYIWDKNWNKEYPIIKWISNQKYILKRGDN